MAETRIKWTDQEHIQHKEGKSEHGYKRTEMNGEGSVIKITYPGRNINDDDNNDEA
jgi:hypothetical protein